MIRNCAFGLLFAGLSGCASLAGSSMDPVELHSAPEGAHFLIETEEGRSIFNGTTPDTVTLAKSQGYFDGADYTITFMKPGYAPAYASLETSPNAWYWAGNLLFGWLYGWLVVDPLGGGMWNFEHSRIDQVLVKQTESKNCRNAACREPKPGTETVSSGGAEARP
jgi:hypothetical protein